MKTSGKVDPYRFYRDYYRSEDKDRTDSERLRKTVRDLNRAGRPREVHAALIGYLANHAKLAEPWMYEALAAAIELNQGSAGDVKIALNYAADLAQLTHNPNHLVSAADQLFYKGYLERVGPLLDEAMPLVPHRWEPIVMSINLAQKTKDARRMADTVESLLALGWPGQDEYFRLESANQVETLARSLREDGKGQEADQLLAKLTASQARDLFVRLTWDGDADFDLLVAEPLGATASYQSPRTVFGGSILKNGYGSHPEEVYVCPRGFAGDYIVRVSVIYTNPDKPVTRLKLETITQEGTSGEKKQAFDLNPDKPDKRVVVHLADGPAQKGLAVCRPGCRKLMKAAAPAMKNTRAPAGARAATPNGGASPDQKSRRPSNEAARVQSSPSVRGERDIARRPRGGYHGREPGSTYSLVERRQMNRCRRHCVAILIAVVLGFGPAAWPALAQTQAESLAASFLPEGRRTGRAPRWWEFTLLIPITL